MSTTLVTDPYDFDKYDFTEVMTDYIGYIQRISDKGEDVSRMHVENVVEEFYKPNTPIQIMALKEKEKIKAFIAYFYGFHVESNKRVAMVSAFSVSKEHRNGEAGTELFKEFINDAKVQGYMQVALTVHHTNKDAEAFYDRFGARDYVDEKMMMIDLY